MLGMEVSGPNPGKNFLVFLVHLFYPAVTALLEYLNPTILHVLTECLLYNSVDVLPYLQKALILWSAPILKLFPYSVYL